MENQTYILSLKGWLMLKLDMDVDTIEPFWRDLQAFIVQSAQLHGFTEGIPVVVFDPDQGPICQLVPQVEKSS